jgi:tetratricopeptide (TPR) repeat protein
MKAACMAAAALVAGCAPVLAEPGGATGRCEAVMQMSATQSAEYERAMEVEVTQLLGDGRYVAVLDVVKQVPSPTAALLNAQGVAYEHLGGFESARLSYEESIKLNPKASVVYNNLGTVFYARHDNKMALKMYKKAIRLNAKFASAYKNLGAAYFHEGKYRRGSEAFEEAITLDPSVFDRSGLMMDAEDAATLANMNYFLAQLCAKSGRADASIAYLNRAIAEGFRDYGKLKKDDAFASVRNLPDFPSPTH